MLVNENDAVPENIRVYIPDMPCAADLVGFLESIDRSTHYTNFGPLECEFRHRIATWIEAGDPPHATTFNSGTSALVAALRVLGLPAGSRVLTPSLTFPATVYAIQAAGLVPVLSDVDATQWRLMPEIAYRNLGRFEAVLPVAAFGAPYPLEAWDQFVEATGVPVVVDAAAALIHRLKTRHCLVVYSLHATKPFGVGEGGLLTTRNPDQADLARRISNFGFDRGSVMLSSGNDKMSEYHAAVALAQLARIEGVCVRLQAVLDLYETHLPGLVRLAGLPSSLVVSVPHGAAALAEDLARAGIETRRWYLPDIALQPAFRDLDAVDDLAVCASLRSRLIGLPFHTRLTEGDVVRIAKIARPHLS